MDKQNIGRHNRADPLETPLLISVPEAARLLGIGVTYGWEMVHRGEVPSIRLGRRVLIPRAALEYLVSLHRSEEP